MYLQHIALWEVMTQLTKSYGGLNLGTQYDQGKGCQYVKGFCLNKV